MAAIQTIYYESSLRDHPRVLEIIDRFRDASLVECEHYGEVFNPRAQNYRVQKQQPALILARKNNQTVLKAPLGYGIGGQNNFYFSHMLNCLYDCRYCFLQGMYRSANYVLFVNYEDFFDAIREYSQQLKSETGYFFSGYDCDSLAFEPVTGFANYFLTEFEKLPNSILELRTKSTQVRSLLVREVMNNVVVAFSFSPPIIAAALEHDAPSFEKRLEAMRKVAERGWQIGLRFDPLIYHHDYQQNYGAMFERIFSVIQERQIHSVNFGAFRLPKNFFQNIVRFYPDEKLFAGPLTEQNAMVSYSNEIEQEMKWSCRQEILRYVPVEKIFECQYET